MVCLRAATKYAALSKKNSLGEPSRTISLRVAVKLFSVVRFWVIFRWIARVVKQVKR